MIKPTNGRVVWYTPARGGPSSALSDAELGMIQHDQSQPLTAHIVHVWGDRLVNLVVFDSNGIAHPRTGVDLQQDGDSVNADGRYAEWMPYQKGQAAKTEQLQTIVSQGAAAQLPPTSS